MKKPYLIDVPVLVYVFIRPDNLEKVFEQIRKARPSILFLVSDGPRERVQGDREKINQSRRVVENIDWDCQVYRLYSEVNQGMYKTGQMAREFIFNKVDRCIFLEDDHVPSVSFFTFCAELLEKYKDDKRIHRICGTNSLGTYMKPNSDYFFSKEGSIWGYATWKRVYDNFDYNHKYGQDNYIMQLLKENSHPDWYKREKLYAQGIMADGHIAGPEFFFQAAVDMQNSLNIVPKQNMISNIGVGDGASNSASHLKKLPKPIQNLFFSKTYELTFPLKHPDYVIADNKYYKEVNKIFALGHPTIRFYRKFEKGIRYAIYGDFSGIIRKIKG